MPGVNCSIPRHSKTKKQKSTQPRLPFLLPHTTNTYCTNHFSEEKSRSPFVVYNFLKARSHYVAQASLLRTSQDVLELGDLHAILGLKAHTTMPTRLANTPRPHSVKIKVALGSLKDRGSLRMCIMRNF